MFDALIKIIDTLIGRTTYDNFQSITLSSNFNPGYSFYLYVGTEGVVNGIDQNGRAFSTKFIIGYHPIKLKTILQSGTTAADLAACF
jgi:hypothetical protein